MANLAARVMPATPRELLDRVKRLERTVAFLRSSRDLVGRASVDTGKAFVVRGMLRVIGSLDLTGTLSMKSEDGLELFRLGDMAIGRGITMARDSGTSALTFRRPFSNSSAQVWELRDIAGTTIVSENSLGRGLGRPFLEHPFQPVAATPGTAVMCGPYGWERTTASDTFETLFAYDGKVQNPFLDFKFAARCSDTTTAGEIQVVDLVTGLPRPGFFASPWVGPVAAGSTAQQVIDPSPDQVITPVAEYGVGGQMRLGVQVRRTAGTGSITLSVAQAIGG